MVEIMKTNSPPHLVFFEEPSMEWSDMKICQELDNRNATTKDLKDELTDVLVQHVCPIGEKIKELSKGKFLTLASFEASI